MKKVSVVVIIVAVVLAISLLATCGIVKLITLCFGWTFSLKVAIGIWLILVLLSNFFKQSRK